MRVIQVTDYGSPYAGSFLPMLDAALTATRERGWDALAVVPPRARTRDWLPGLHAEHGSDLVFSPEGGRWELTRWLEELVDSSPGPTLLHAHWTVFDVPVAVIARRRPDVRALWHFNTVLSERAGVRVRNRVRFTIGGRYVDRILCVAPHLAEATRARGAPADRVEYFPNGVDVAGFPGPAGREERAAARLALGLDPAATVLLHIGRDWHLKGGDLFLDAFEELDAPGAVALMVRGGDEARGEIERRGLAHRAQVLEGTADMRRLHAAADLMLATSRGEGMPFAVVEALSSGLGVVLTDIPGHTLPDGGPPGVRIAELAPEPIAARARELLGREPAAARREGELAHEWVRREFGLDVWAQRLMDTYESVAGSWAK